LEAWRTNLLGYLNICRATVRHRRSQGVQHGIAEQDGPVYFPPEFERDEAP
jgi:hypothetical protein